MTSKASNKRKLGEITNVKQTHHATKAIVKASALKKKQSDQRVSSSDQRDPSDKQEAPIDDQNQ